MTYLIDIMVAFQSYRQMKVTTFKELVEQCIQKILQSVANNCDNLNKHLVGDRYNFDPTEIIKGGERETSKALCRATFQIACARIPKL